MLTGAIRIDSRQVYHLYVLPTYIIYNQLVKRLIYVYQQLVTTQISVTRMYS